GIALSDLAKRINAEHQAAERAYQTAIGHALKCGDALIVAKSRLPHGEWMRWLNESCPAISDWTARVYMQVARHREEIEAKLAGSANLRIERAIELTAPKSVSGSIRQH